MYELSICIPTYNRAKLLNGAIESIPYYRCEQQAFYERVINNKQS